MTENTLTFQNSNETKRWLETKTNATLIPVHAKAKTIRDNMNQAIEGVEEVSKFLFDSSTKEIEKRNMKVYNRARALNKLARLFLDRFKKLTPPERITYDTMKSYLDETQKMLLVTDIDIKNWFPRISPFFIMDRRKFLQTYEKARQAYMDLNDFVVKDYVKTKTLEEALHLIAELEETEKQLANIEQDKENIKNERLPIEQEITELEQKIMDLKNKGPVDKLNLINTEINALTEELKNTMRHLQKPFIKMQALATGGGGGGVTPDELSKITQYLDTPFEALVSEQPGYPILKEILEKLERFLAEDKLKLKPDKARKAEQSIAEILHNNSLANLQVRCIEMATNKEHLLASSKMDEINQNISTYQDQVTLLKARKTSVETHETVKGNYFKDVVDKISNLKRNIERDVYSALNVKIQLT
jgi:hypothetical protein